MLVFFLSFFLSFLGLGLEDSHALTFWLLLHVKVESASLKGMLTTGRSLAPGATLRAAPAREQHAARHRQDPSL